MPDSTKCAEVRRILQRYVVEVVERYQLCPWARSARDNGEVGIEVVFGTPTPEEWLAAVDRAFGSPRIRVAMIVAPELVVDHGGFRVVRDRVAAKRRDYGIAEFHPRAALDLATPARLVRYLRRSPDPLLQLVPLSLLATMRASALPDRARQAQILLGLAQPPRDIVAQLAEINHATVSVQHAAIEATLDDIARDREVSYTRVGIQCVPVMEMIA